MNTRLARTLTMAAIVALISACQPTAPPAKTAAETPETLDLTVQSLLTVWNSNDVVMLDSVYTPDFQRTAPNGNVTGVEAMKELVRGFHTAYPDFHLTGDQVVYRDNIAFLRWTATGTNTGDGATKATGNSVTLSGVSMFTFRDNRIASEEVFFDNADLQAQLAVKK